MHNGVENLWQLEIPGGQHWSGIVRRGTRLRLTAQGRTANAAMLLYNHEDRMERYNMADTLKAQHTAVLTCGHVLMSDMGRVLAAIVADEAGGHETICGVSDAAEVAARHGQTRFQWARNARFLSGREGLLAELRKWGLDAVDLVASVNWFSVLEIDQGGRVALRERDVTGASVDLYFEMDTLVVMSTAPHPLDEALAYTPAAITIKADRLGAAASESCRLHCAENSRAYANTHAYLAQREGV